MADQSRQTKLAAAKKKLKEFQQKSSPANGGGEKVGGGGGGAGGGAGPKKKKKMKGNLQDTPSPADRLSPDNIESILKALSQTNGVALPLHGNSQAYQEPEPSGPPVPQLLEDPGGEPGRGSPVSNPASFSPTTNPECASYTTDLLQQCHSPDTNGNGTSLQDDSRPLSSTESLRQLSQQLNGLVSESSAAYVNGDGAPSPANEKELESRNQELAAALDSSNLANTQLSTKLAQLTQHSQEISDQLQKDRKEFEQKFAREQGAMREQLQVHIQTIGILVSEKSELQTALQYTQQAARHKTGEAEELSNRFQATKQRVSELERTLSSLSTQQKQAEKQNKELEKERDSLRLELYRLSAASEESRQQGSELAEQLKLKSMENEAMRVDLDELRSRLEMADVMLQQFSSQSGPPDANQQMQLLLQEKQQLEVHATQLMESVVQLQQERDRYAEQIQEEGRVWKDKTEQLLAQMTLVAEERDRSISLAQGLEAHVNELRSAAALLSQEKEIPVQAQPSGPSDRELSLQEALRALQQERDALNSQYHAQLHDNQQLSRMCSEQEARLSELERAAERQAEDEGDRRRMLEDVQSDKATISRALAQNRTLKDQLAELQNGFVQLTNENMELTSAIQSEQHVKKELARRMGELQEDMHNIKEQLEQKVQECQSLVEQRDQLASHLQQYCAGYQTLAAEREEVHRQYLHQSQLMDRLQHDETQGRVQLGVSHRQLEQAQERLDQLARDNDQLKTEVQELLNSSALAVPDRDQGDGVASQPLSSSVVIPEDFDSQEEMEQFIRGVLSRVEAERDEMRCRLEEERRLHLEARQQAAATHHREEQLHSHHHADDDGYHDHHDHDHHDHDHHDSCDHEHHSEHQLDHEHSGGGVSVEVHQSLQFAMEKLQHRFTSLMQEKADLKERVEELEHRCIQLSGETDTIGEYIALYQNQRAIMKQKHSEKEHYINMLAQDKEEMKAKLAELQELVLRLVEERNEWYSRYAGALAAGASLAEPDLLPQGQGQSLGEGEEQAPLHHHHHHQQQQQQAPTVALTRMELNAVDGAEPMEPHHSLEPTPGSEPFQASLLGSEPQPLGPVEDGTARQIMQLLQEIQHPQGPPRAPPFLGENPCIPFFYRPDEQDEVKILVV